MLELRSEASLGCVSNQEPTVTLSLIFMNLCPLLVTALWWWLTRKLRSFGHFTLSPKNCNFIFCSVPFLSFFVLLRLLIIYCNQNKCEWKMNEWNGKWTAQDDHFAGLVWPSSTKYCWQRSSVQIVLPPFSQVKPVSTLLKMWNPWINWLAISKNYPTIHQNCTCTRMSNNSSASHGL